jgi:hypothetical protein
MTTLSSLSPAQPPRRSNFAQACLASCRKLLDQIERAKARIVADFRARINSDEHLLELAVNEAEALAFSTGYPQLVFPVLAEENARAVEAWHARQQDLFRTSRSTAAGD